MKNSNNHNEENYKHHNVFISTFIFSKGFIHIFNFLWLIISWSTLTLLISQQCSDLNHSSHIFNPKYRLNKSERELGFPCSGGFYGSTSYKNAQRLLNRHQQYSLLLLFLLLYSLSTITPFCSYQLGFSTIFCSLEEAITNCRIKELAKNDFICSPTNFSKHNSSNSYNSKFIRLL